MQILGEIFHQRPPMGRAYLSAFSDLQFSNEIARAHNMKTAVTNLNNKQIYGEDSVKEIFYNINGMWHSSYHQHSAQQATAGGAVKSAGESNFYCTHAVYSNIIVACSSPQQSVDVI
ncbi:unnamed protein product [Ceratitis capitata]|uniref:(Mediterranean fruit fly) hypothetical protein n=1 Tax=Ceratitis capitata TaxID=7213 RepID=A0A811V375_CERCA|nr:unnamed protein product [Ceratitis capitata]